MDMRLSKTHSEEGDLNLDQAPRLALEIAFAECEPDAPPEKLRKIGWDFDETGRLIPWGKE